MSGPFSLQGRVVLVAGALGGIGSALTRAAAQAGGRVAVAGRDEAQCAQFAARLIEEEHCEAMGVAIDVRSPEAVAAGVAAVTERFGALDVLMNCVGTHIEQKAEDMTMEAWDNVFAVNLRGAFILSQAVARAMIAAQKGGSIVHITSVRSTLGIRRGYAAYCASKGGLAILIKQLATEWAEHGIRVNGIGPTFTRTPLVEQYLNDPQFYGALVNRIPLGRVCETRDLTGLAIFLASDASAFITGQNILVDGGLTATQ